jgi:pyrroloquinoline quinone (PQQ) biosynthesis protein C
MEHFKNPFSKAQLTSDQALDHGRFLHTLLADAKAHAFYAHPFIRASPRAQPSPEAVSFILTSYYKIVSPFTTWLATLGARAPSLSVRFALMDNLYEEMGCGTLQAAHPSLYLKMLASIGVSAEAAEAAPTLPSIQRINDHMRKVTEQRPFAVACAVVASVESTIPPKFPVMARLAQAAFPHVDMEFFDRHGPRDDGHSNDASMIFALTADLGLCATLRDDVRLDLDYRVELMDDWVAALDEPSRMAS